MATAEKIGNTISEFLHSLVAGVKKSRKIKKSQSKPNDTITDNSHSVVKARHSSDMTDAYLYLLYRNIR